MVLRRLFFFFQAFVLFLTMGACKTREFHEESAPKTVAFPADRVMTVNWPCISKRSEPGLPQFNNQEEYCEWTRVIRKTEVDASGNSVSGKLECEFTTNFDQSRPRFLSMSRNKSGFSQSINNSLPFLIGSPASDPECISEFCKIGLVPACIERKGVCSGIECVCGRKSDPQLCAAIGTAVNSGCTISADASRAKTFRAPQGSQLPIPFAALTLEIGETLKENCFYKNQRNEKKEDVVIPGVKPEDERSYVRCFFDKGAREKIRSCDDVAKSLIVTARFKLECNDAALARVKTLEGKVPDACQ